MLAAATLAGFLAGLLFVGVAYLWAIASSIESFEIVGGFLDTAPYSGLPWAQDGEDWPTLGEADTPRCGSAGQQTAGEDAQENPWDVAFAECIAEQLDFGMSMRNLLELRPRIPASFYSGATYNTSISLENCKKAVTFHRRISVGKGMRLSETYTIVENRLKSFVLRFDSEDTAKAQELLGVLTEVLQKKWNSPPVEKALHKKTDLQGQEPSPLLEWGRRGKRMAITHTPLWPSEHIAPLQHDRVTLFGEQAPWISSWLQEQLFSLFGTGLVTPHRHVESRTLNAPHFAYLWVAKRVLEQHSVLAANGQTGRIFHV